MDLEDITGKKRYRYGEESKGEEPSSKNLRTAIIGDINDKLTVMNSNKPAELNARYTDVNMIPSNLITNMVTETTDEKNPMEKIKKEIDILNDHIDNYQDMYTGDARIEILNRGIVEMRQQIESIQNANDKVKLDEIKMYLYSWAVTKMSQIMQLSQKTIGILTVLGLFSTYSPDFIVNPLYNNYPFLQPLIDLSKTMKPLIIGTQISGSAIITGYYILLKSGFDKKEVDDIIDNIKQKVNETLKEAINYIKLLFNDFFVEKYEDIRVSFTPSPELTPPPPSNVIIPALSQHVYENIKTVGNDLDELLSHLKNIDSDLKPDTDLTQYFTPIPNNDTQYGTPPSLGGRRHKRRTYRRRSTKHRRSSHKKRRHTNRRKSRRSKRSRRSRRSRRSQRR